MRVDPPAYLDVFPYRTAMVASGIIFPRKALDFLYELIPSRERDNHIVAQYMDDNGKTFYVMFSDDFAQLGTEVVERRW